MKITKYKKSRKKIYSPVTNFEILKQPQQAALSSENMVTHNKKKSPTQNIQTLQQSKDSYEYLVYHANSEREFTKTYRGEWDQVSKKAWRDLKQVVRNSDLIFEITNLATEEKRRYDFRGWTPQKRSYNKERLEKWAKTHQF